MSDLLSSLFKKERPWANRSCCSRFLLKKSHVSDSLVIRAYLSQKTSDSRGKKCIFHMFLTVFPPVYAKRANHSHHSSQSRSILKIDGINLVSCYCERIAPVSLFERATASESPSCHPISTRRVNTLRVHSLRRNLTCVMSRTGNVACRIWSWSIHLYT